MGAGLARFTVDGDLVWSFEGHWNGSPRGIEHVYFVHVDADGGAIVWDGLGQSLNFVDPEGRIRQVEWDSERLDPVGALRAGDDVWLLAVEDSTRVVLIQGSPRGAEFGVDRIERVDVPPSENLWRSERWRTRDDRVDLVVDGRWYRATLGELLAQR